VNQNGASHRGPTARGVVTTAHPAATAAGCEILRCGGNTVDAAAAAAWALAVCEPSGSGLGGQTTMLVRAASGQTVAVDGHSRAPAAASKRTVTRSQQHAGHRASTVPTTPATLDHIWKRWGSLSLTRVLEPAIALAEDGFEVTELHSRQLGWCRKALNASTGGRHFLRDGRRYLAGERFRQPQLARCLARLAREGIEDFYSGEVARATVRDMKRNDGLIDAADLQWIGPPLERQPLEISYGDHKVLTIPPPGGGVELLLALRLLDRLSEDGRAHEPELWYARIADVTSVAFAEREHDPAHPDHWSDELGDLLLGDERVDTLAHGIPSQPLVAAGPGEEAGETTHLCVADAEGNVVSLTQSIQSLFGAKVGCDELGFLYNNYLTTCPRRPHRYRLGPLACARSNAAPTLVVGRGGDGAPVLALGGAGSRRIVSAVLHAVSGVLDRGVSLPEALDQPRAHARPSGTVWLERPAARSDVVRSLRSRFREIEIKPALSYCMGAVQGIEFRDGRAYGAADPRRDGVARGC
jgi:gamma-glutamyltranspeptidase / glutathione hydrolase